MRIISHSAKETLKIGHSLAKKLSEGDIVCLFGELGSGKTVLAKGIAEGLGVNKSEVVSPSFVLIRLYSTGRLALHHFDLYRLKEPEDIIALGYEEYLYDSGVTVIEWAQRLKYLLPKEYLKVELYLRAGSKRLLELSAFGERYEKILRGFKGKANARVSLRKNKAKGVK